MFFLKNSDLEIKVAKKNFTHDDENEVELIEEDSLYKELSNNEINFVAKICVISAKIENSDTSRDLLQKFCNLVNIKFVMPVADMCNVGIEFVKC